MYEATFPIAEVLISILGLFAAALLAIVFYMFRDLGKRIATTNSTLEDHRKETKADIKALRQETKAEFDKVNNRFGEIHREFNNRFDKVNDRFGEIHREFNNRFDKVNNRFDKVNDQFGEIHREVNDRFGEIHREVNDRFGEIHREVNDRFDKVNNRFDKVNDQFGEVRREFNERFDNLDKRVNENTNAISELKGMTSALLSRQTGTTGEDESDGSPEAGKRQRETPGEQVEMPAAEIGLIRKQQENPEQPEKRPELLTENPAISGEATDRGTQAIARSEAN